MGVCGAGGGDDFLARGIGFAVGDVLGDGAEEQERFLQHQPDVAPIFGDRHGADVDAVDQDRTFGNVVETTDQVDHGALAGTGMADETDHFARFDGEADVARDAARPVAETDITQFDAAGNTRQMYRIGGFGHAGNVVEDVEDALGAGSCLLRDRDDAAHRVETGVEAANVGEKGCQHADRDVVFGNQPDADAPDDQ